MWQFVPVESETPNKITKMSITQQWIAAEVAKAGLKTWDDVSRFNQRSSAEAQEMLSWGTNVVPRGPGGALNQRGDLYHFGGTGQCGNKWSAKSGGWYPIAAVIRCGKRGGPKLVAVKMDWY